MPQLRVRRPLHGRLIEVNIVQLKKVFREILADAEVIDALVCLIEGLSKLAARTLKKKIQK